MSMLIRLIVIALLANWCLPLSAQTLIKCKQPNGSYSFQDTPCASSANQETLRVDPRGGLKPAPSASQEASGTTAVEPKSTASGLPPTAAPAPTPPPEAARSPAIDRAPAAEPMPEPTSEPTPEPTAPTISGAGPEMKPRPDSIDDRKRATPESWNESTSTADRMGLRSLILFGIGFAIVVISSIWIIVLGFMDSVLWGLLCLLISFPCQIIFSITHWDKCKIPFLISIGGYVVMIVGAVI